MVSYRVYEPQEEAKRIADTIRPILKKYDVIRADLFGSAARGDMGPESDIDVLVDLPRGNSGFGLVHLKMDLERRLGRKVDVVTYRSVHPYIKDSVFETTLSVV